MFISLAIWLELYLTTQQQNLSPYLFDFSGDFTVPGGGDKTNDFVANTIQDKVYNSDQFIADNDCPLGSHSNQKRSATRARACGATRDERDYCGHWKRDHRVSDCYGGDLLYPDAKVASFLCVEGCRNFGAYRLEFSSSIRQLVGLGGLFCQLNVTEQGSLVTTI